MWILLAKCGVGKCIMPMKRNEEIPLPAGWTMARDFDGKIYFIDHNSQQTSWIDPRDR